MKRDFVCSTQHMQQHRSCVHAQNMEDVNIVIRGRCHQGSWVMQACILGVLPSRQLGYAGMHLCAYATLYQDMLVCAHGGIGACGASIHELVSGATLAQDKNCGCGLHPSHSLVFPPTTLGEQSLCYCRHAVSICFTKPTTGLSPLGGGNSL